MHGQRFLVLAKISQNTLGAMERTRQLEMRVSHNQPARIISLRMTMFDWKNQSLIFPISKSFSAIGLFNPYAQTKLSLSLLGVSCRWLELDHNVGIFTEIENLSV